MISRVVETNDLAPLSSLQLITLILLLINSQFLDRLPPLYGFAAVWVRAL
jgi:hypothetical protein